MFNGPVFNNEVVQANSRAVNNAGFSESLDEANSLYSRLTGASFELVPSSYKGGVVYSGVPNTGNGDITWTRGSDAWRTNADGLIQRVPWNLFQHSEAFDSLGWAKNSVLVTPNTTISPDGNTTADTLSVGVDAVSVRHRLLSNSIGSQVIGTTYTSTYYLKANEHQWIQILGNIGYLTGVWANFDLVNGAIGNTGANATASIDNVGNGWYRCRVSGVATGTTTTGFEIIVINNTNGGRYPSYQSLTAEDVCYVWGAQLVEGSLALPYFPTTDRLNVPRLSYMYGSCPALLLEPQRTNLALYSEQLDNVSWGKVFSSVTANSTTSPDGNTTADTFTADGSNNQHYVGGATSGTITSGSSCTYTIYAKKNTNNFIQLWIANTFGGMFANFDLNNGVVGTLGTGGTGSNPTSSITSVGNGWYRCSMTFVPTTTGVVGLLVAMTSSASTVRAETNTLSTSVFLWGAQLEQGAYPTTYIPTTTASATRVADSFSRNNIYTNGLITAAGGTWFVELRGNVAYTRDGTGNFWIGDSSADGSGGTVNSLTFRNNGGGSPRLAINKVINGTLTALYTTTTDTSKIAIKWNGTSVDVFVNGTKQVSASAFTPTNMEFLRGATSDVPKFIQQMALFPTPLSDDQCVALTSDFTEGESVIGSYERYVNSNGGAVENLNTITNLIQNLK